MSASQRDAEKPLRVGVDIGGTFTDLIAFDARTGALSLGKTLTTPAEPARGVITGMRETLATAGEEPGAVGGIVHGTTLVTNALIERKGAVTALLATEGFRDAVEIRREGPVRPVRPLHRDARAPRAAPSSPRRPRARACGWHGTDTARHGADS